jgi:hypothetical protein
LRDPTPITPNRTISIKLYRYRCNLHRYSRGCQSSTSVERCPPQGSGSREPLFGRSAALVSPTHVFPPLEGACGFSGSLLLGPLDILKYDPSQYFNYNSQAHISYFTKNGSPIEKAAAEHRMILNPIVTHCSSVFQMVSSRQ